MKPRRLQNRAISTKWNCEHEPIKLLMIAAGRCTALRQSHQRQPQRRIRRKHSAHQEGHFYHARFYSRCLPDTVSTGLRLPGNQLESEDCSGTGRGEPRTGRMECSVSFVWNWDAAFTVFFSFCSSPLLVIIFILFFPCLFNSHAPYYQGTRKK